jgi:cation transport ATPase
MTKAPRAQSAKDVSHRNLANIALAASVLGLGVGAALRVTSQTNVANVLWIGVAAGGAVYAAIAIVSALRQRRVGVDVIALLAVVGAIAVGEYLAAAVIGVMIASGRSLESWAGVRARRSLDALVSRVPSSARRYHGSQLETVALGTVRPGDRLAIGPGELVPVDGTVVSAVAVLDESTLTGESKPMEHALGEPIRSGTVNAGGPVDLPPRLRPARTRA